jgi:hypothetical protein
MKELEFFKLEERVLFEAGAAAEIVAAADMAQGHTVAGESENTAETMLAEVPVDTANLQSGSVYTNPSELSDSDVNINDLEWTAHEWELVGGSAGHWDACAVCNYYSTVIPHTFTYTYGNVGHVATCTDCGYSITATHSMTYTGYDANGHTRSCSCGYSVPATHTFSGNYVNNGSTHGRSCVCGYTETIAHTLSYHHNVDTHWRECSVCDYATAPVAHIFVNGRCRVCNALQIETGPASIIAIPEEDELLPVPEDQKATL